MDGGVDDAVLPEWHARRTAHAVPHPASRWWIGVRPAVRRPTRRRRAQSAAHLPGRHGTRTWPRTGDRRLGAPDLEREPPRALRARGCALRLRPVALAGTDDADPARLSATRAQRPGPVRPLLPVPPGAAAAARAPAGRMRRQRSAVRDQRLAQPEGDRAYVRRRAVVRHAAVPQLARARARPGDVLLDRRAGAPVRPGSVAADVRRW